ncbi:MAG: O-antigen ligase family protein [Candidatus Sumerlaeia bacterium]|nr:O-antigen ligase family protein [Candidatus Sumerlaeia bacterium]
MALNLPTLMERAQTAVMLLAAAGTALFICTPTYDQFILPKMVWVKVLTAAALVLTGLRLAIGGDFRLRLHWLNLALLLFIGWKAVSWFWAESRSLAADDICWWAALGLWALLFQDWLRNDRRRLRQCAAALTLSALAIALGLLVQDFAVAFYQNMVAGVMHLPASLRDPLRWMLDRLTGAQSSIAKLPDWRGHLWAGMGNTNHIADYLAVLFPMLFLQYLTAEGKVREVLSLITLVAGAAALIACYSVGSNGGLILAGAVMGILLVVHESGEFWRRRALRLGVLAALWAAVVGFYVVPHRLNPHPGGIFAQAFGSERWRAGWPTRVAIWLTSWEVVRQHPLAGTGAGNFTYAYAKTLSPRVLADPGLAVYAGMYTNAAHNELLQAWVETGAIGALVLVLLWAVFLVAVLRRLGDLDAETRRLRVVLAAMMTAFIAHSMMNFTLQLPTSSLLFAGMISAAAVLRGREEFPLRLRMPHAGVEVDLETTEMRRIQSAGVRLGDSRAIRVVVAAVAVAVGGIAASRAVHPIAADTLFNRAKVAALWYQAWPEVADLTRRALAVNPRHHTARKLLGDALLAVGDYEGARAAYERVAERESVFDYYDKWGRACWALGDRDGAQRAWTVYFTRRPQTREKDTVLFQLFSREFPDAAARLP